VTPPLRAAAVGQQIIVREVSRGTSLWVVTRVTPRYCTAEPLQGGAARQFCRDSGALNDRRYGYRLTAYSLAAWALQERRTAAIRTLGEHGLRVDHCCRLSDPDLARAADAVEQALTRGAPVDILRDD